MEWFERVRTLLDAPSPATLTAYRADGTAFVSPVWFRFEDGAFDAVIAEGDAKLRNLERTRVWDLASILPAEPA